MIDLIEIQKNLLKLHTKCLIILIFLIIYYFYKMVDIMTPEQKRIKQEEYKKRVIEGIT